MTRLVCESNVDVRRAAGRSGTIFIDRVEKTCSARSPELKHAILSVRVENSGEKR